MITITDGTNTIELPNPEWGYTESCTDSKTIHKLNDGSLITYFKENYAKTIMLSLNFNFVKYTKTMEFITKLLAFLDTELSLYYNDYNLTNGHIITNPINFIGIASDCNESVRYKCRFNFSFEFIGRVTPSMNPL